MNRGERAAFGVWVFLASEWLFFGGLLAAYGQARWAQPQGFDAAGRHVDVWLGTANTALLLTSSAVAAAALAAAQAGRCRSAARLLAGTALLGAGFLAIKGIEYHGEWREHLWPSAGFALAGVAGARQFFSLYWLMTGVHAVHLSAGIGVMAVLAWRWARAAAPPPAARVEAAALYWHFVDIVWIVLYPLLYLLGRSS